MHDNHTTLDPCRNVLPANRLRNTRRAIDFHEGETVDEKALQTLIRAAVMLNRSKARK
jgi:hypothetical protein